MGPKIMGKNKKLTEDMPYQDQVWELLFVGKLAGLKRSVSVPLVRRRCAHYRLVRSGPVKCPAGGLINTTELAIPLDLLPTFVESAGQSYTENYQPDG